MVRLPDGMRERIAKEAKANNRSMNAEIVHRLDRTLSEPAGDQKVGPKHRYLVLTLDLSYAAKFISTALKFIPMEAHERQGMTHFIKKYLLPEDLEAKLEAEYKSTVNQAIREMLDEHDADGKAKDSDD